MYRINNIHGSGIKLKKQQGGMCGSRCGCGGEILLGSPVALAPTPIGAGMASFPNLAKLDIPKIKKSKMKKISF